ncbi:protein of unknown function DUF362 [Denitrovibrio acetiphilus DSM 12809]|uniref:4Fe-4S ferredoxin-type domain-containing protein n=1 Tax=Denitrovibrio acetiphilus (strain DSM 12809 / NBRC 114555 / N2460) TaxID=522772 RepID=D4H7U4_DENA2|nr:DUF362 domain-containing protein [Denitrovibrio acetiphilus]ADD68093.1 protein of unknown function DUF362 [Denitrovibrio acetiphilus DSM 12809]
MNNIYKAHCKGYHDTSLQKMIENYFYSERDRLAGARRILIKPNLLSASIPEKAVTTHPDFVRTVIRILREYTEAELWLGDSPGANFGKYDKVLEVTGMTKVAEETGVHVVRVESFEPVSRGGIVYSSLAEEVDIILNLPKLKTHGLTGMTLAVKNLFGLIPGTAKVGYHRDFPVDTELAAQLYKYFGILGHKTMNIIDGIIGMEGDGPSKGTPVELGIAAASSDAVGLDIAVTRMVGLKDEFCLTTKAAIAAGYDKSHIDVPETNIPLIKKSLSKKVYLPPFLKQLVAKQVYVKPVVLNEKCILCMLCMKSCPVDAIAVINDFPFVDKKKCIECFCCHEVCESDAVGLERSWLHKLVVGK